MRVALGLAAALALGGAAQAADSRNCWSVPGWIATGEGAGAALTPERGSPVFIKRLEPLEDPLDEIDGFVDRAESASAVVRRTPAATTVELGEGSVVVDVVARTDDGPVFRRYVATDAPAFAVLQTPGESAPPEPARAFLGLLKSAADCDSLSEPDFPASRPGDGGLDGLYVGAARAWRIDADGVWRAAERADVLAFDASGEVYSGLPWEGPDGDDWTAFCGQVGSVCGRYRAADGRVEIRWPDGGRESLDLESGAILARGYRLERAAAPDADSLPGSYVVEAARYGLGEGVDDGRAEFSEDGRFRLTGALARQPDFGGDESGTESRAATR